MFIIAKFLKRLCPIVVRRYDLTRRNVEKLRSASHELIGRQAKIFNILENTGNIAKISSSTILLNSSMEDKLY